MRRFGEPARPDIGYRFRRGVYAVVRDGDDLLVTEQAGQPPEFQLPGGGIDPGESTLPALHRECLEETGWKIAVIRRLGAFQRFTYMPDYRIWAQKVCHVYLARPTLRMGPPRDPGHRAFWMPAGVAAGLLTVEGERRIVASLAP